MRYQKLGLCGVCAVLVFNWMVPARASQSAGEMAVLRGKIQFSGTVPLPTLFNTASDPKCVAIAITSEDVLVSDNGLENVMVYVSSPVASSGPIGSAVTLDQRDCRFDPHMVTLQAGQT